jgi:hypothetical protein
VLDSVDESLERFIRSAVPLSARNTDVSFEAPDREWAAKLNNRPTVNLFLWDIKKSTDRSRTGLETYEHDGQTKRRMALPRIELRYLISTWTAEHTDDRILMGGLLRVLLGHAEIPQEFVAEPLRGLSPLTMTMTRGGEAGIDVFKALDGQLKPTLDVVIVTDVDTDLGEVAAAPVEEFAFVLSDSTMPGRQSTSRRVAGQVNLPNAAGRVVVSPRGRATIDPAGRFLVRGQPGDELIVDIDPPQTVIVPEHGGVVIG